MPPPLAPPTFCEYIYGLGDCSDLNYCGIGLYGRNNFVSHGVCEAGLCLCDTGYTGNDCSEQVDCKYWDTRSESWSTEGCIASPPPSRRPDGFLHCNCTHLTDFGGVTLPMSADELLAVFTSVKFTMFSLDDAAQILSEFDIAGNPAIFSLLVTVTALDLLTISHALFRRL